MTKLEDPSSYDLKKLREIADFQFGKKAGKAVFPDNVKIEKSKSTRRIKFIYLNTNRIFSFRVTDGVLIPSILGAKRLFENDFGKKVMVDNEAEPFVKKGKTVFAKYVIKADQSIQVKEEVLLLNKGGELIGYGTAKLSGKQMKEMNLGVAVNTRKGIIK